MQPAVFMWASGLTERLLLLFRNISGKFVPDSEAARVVRAYLQGLNAFRIDCCDGFEVARRTVLHQSSFARMLVPCVRKRASSC